MTDLFSVSGKIAVVTGGSDGIGQMITQGLVEAGAKTYIVARNLEKARKAADELSGSGSCIPIQGDLATLAGIDAVVAQLSELESRVDILINNAGVHRFEALEEFDEESWDSHLDLNLKTPMFMIRKMLPLLREAGTPEDPARVINIGSTDGKRVSDMEHYPYYASKAGVHQISRALGRRLGPEWINVNAIAPGPFPTAVTDVGSPELREQIKKGIPCRRFGSPEDIMGSVIYLCSRAGAYTNATILSVDGGIAGA